MKVSGFSLPCCVNIHSLLTVTYINSLSLFCLQHLPSLPLSDLLDWFLLPVVGFSVCRSLHRYLPAVAVSACARAYTFLSQGETTPTSPLVFLPEGSFKGRGGYILKPAGCRNPPPPSPFSPTFFYIPPTPIKIFSGAGAGAVLDAFVSVTSLLASFNICHAGTAAWWVLAWVQGCSFARGGYQHHAVCLHQAEGALCLLACMHDALKLRKSVSNKRAKTNTFDTQEEGEREHCRCMNGWVDRWMDGWIDRWIDG